MKGRLFAVALAAYALCACHDNISQPATSSDAGEAGGAGGVGGDSGMGDCPDPTNPGVHYQAMDIAQCPIETFMCQATQNGFYNACGCGCIDKGTVLCMLDPTTTHFISEDPAECGSIMPDCPFGQTPFNNSCGCGCADE